MTMLMNLVAQMDSQLSLIADTIFDTDEANGRGRL